MIARASALVCAILASSACRPAPTQLAWEQPEVRQQLARTSELGRDIHRRFQLVWGAMVELTMREQPFTAIMVDADHTDRVLVVDDASGQPRVTSTFRCELQSGGAETRCRMEAETEPKPPSATNLAQYRAIDTARRDPRFAPTTKYHLPVVVPIENGHTRGWQVYLIAYELSRTSLLLGRHHRSLISADGRTVETFDALGEGASIDFEPTGIPRGPGAMVSIHDMHAKLPTEMHVWTALAYGVDLLVFLEADDGRRDMPMTWAVRHDGSIIPF